MQADDVEGYVALLHPEFQYVRHKSGDSLGREEMAALLGKVWSGGNRRIESMRCLYENDDIMVMHTVLSFRSGSREGAMIVHMLQDGLVRRVESGVSDLN